MAETISIDRVAKDAQNRNRGTGRGRRAVKASLEAYGAGRSILLDKHGVVIAGNASLNAALELGIDDVVVVESDGTKLVAVKRTDLDLTEKQGKARGLSIADNAASFHGYNPDLTALADDLRSGLELPDAIFSADEVSAMLAKSVEAAASLGADLERGQTFGGGIPAAEGANNAPQAPGEFPSYDEGIETEYCCPRCAYCWSGKPR